MTRSSGQPITIVIRFDVPSENQAELVELMSSSLADVLRRRPGYLDGAILPSDDGTHVLNVTMWRGHDDLAAARRDDAAKKIASRMAALGAEPHPAVYSTKPTFRAAPSS
jgi:heme-degrading monooxygenase HmoA